MTKEDLLQISTLLDAKLQEQKQDLIGCMEAKLQEQKQEIIQECTANMNIIIESNVTPKFNLLADAIAEINQKLTPQEKIEEIENEIEAIKIVQQIHAKEIRALKKAL